MQDQMIIVGEEQVEWLSTSLSSFSPFRFNLCLYSAPSSISVLLSTPSSILFTHLFLGCLLYFIFILSISTDSWFWKSPPLIREIQSSTSIILAEVFPGSFQPHVANVRMNLLTSIVSKEHAFSPYPVYSWRTVMSLYLGLSISSFFSFYLILLKHT